MGTNGKVISNVEELEALDNNYVLGKAGSVGSWGSGIAPNWFLDSIRDAINVEGVRSGELLNSLRAIVRNLEVGVNQSIYEINNDIVSNNGVVNTIVSRLNGNESAIFTIEDTYVDKTKATALSLKAMHTEFTTPGSVANTWVVDSTQSISDAVQATNETLNLLSSEFATSDGMKASAEKLNTSFTTSGLAPDGTLQAGAGEFGQLRAMVNGIGVTLTSQDGVHVGTPKMWNGVTGTEKVGVLSLDGIQQFMGGSFGPLADGWVAYKGPAVPGTATVYSGPGTVAPDAPVGTPVEGDPWVSTDMVYAGTTTAEVRRYTDGAWVLQTQEWAASIETNWIGGASKLVRGDDGSITGWSFGADNWGTSNFVINADNFRIMGGNHEAKWNQSFSIEAGAGPNGENLVQFNGIVDFTNSDVGAVLGKNIMNIGYSTMDGVELPMLVASGINTIQRRTDTPWIRAEDSAVAGAMLHAHAADTHVYLSTSGTDYNIATPTHRTLIVSAYVKVNGGNGAVQIHGKTDNGVHTGASHTIPINVWTRISVVVHTGSNTKMVVRLDNDGYVGVSVAMGFGSVMVEVAVGGNTVPTKFVPPIKGAASTDLSNVTRIDGSKITTGKIQSHDGNTYFKLGSATEAAQIKMSNGAGFTLDSTATGDSPNIEGAYIKGATMLATTLSVRDLKMLTDSGQETDSILYSEATTSSSTGTPPWALLQFDIFTSNSTSVSKNKLGRTHGARVQFTGSTSSTVQYQNSYVDVTTVRTHTYSYHGWVILGSFSMQDRDTTLSFDILLGSRSAASPINIPVGRETTLLGITVYLQQGLASGFSSHTYMLFVKPVNVLGEISGQGALGFRLTRPVSLFSLGMTVYNL